MTINQKIEKVKQYEISVDNRLSAKISGVYGFFAVKNETETCFYIGKAINMCDRIFSTSHGHIGCYLKYKDAGIKNKSETLIIDEIEKYRDNKFKIELRLLEEINMHEERYERAAQKLAFAEYLWIEKYQQKGQCMNQLPEGADRSRKYWENNIKGSD